MNNNQKIIIEAFGLTAVKTLPHIGIGVGNNIASQNVYKATVPKQQGQDIANGISVLGTPVFDNLMIKAGSYEVNGQTVDYDTMTFDSVLITLTQSHNVILTPIQGRDNEVIEYIGKFSFRINIKGGIFGINNNRPIKDIANFVKMVNSNKPLQVIAGTGTSSGFLSEWNISQFVILDKSMPQIAGGYNYQLFEINAIQDVPVILAQQQYA